MQQRKHDGVQTKGLTEAANAVSEALDARVFAYSGSIDPKGFGLLVESMQISEEQPYRANSLLILTTHGGLADSAYQIARLFQKTSDCFYVVIASRCKSAGTLVALGANELIMSPVSELGPLDVQIMQRDEIGQRRSGLVVRTALEGLAGESFALFEHIMLRIKAGSSQTVSFEVASRIAAEIAVGLMAPVYSQISPDALGNDLRNLHVATEYGTRLIAHGGNADSDTVQRLVEDYPAHGFIIDKAEADTLFAKVSEPDTALNDLIAAAGQFVYAEHSPHYVKRLDCIEETEDAGSSEESRIRAGSPRMDAGRKTKGGGDPKGGGEAGK